MGRTYKRWSAEDLIQIQTLKDKGVTVGEIARRFGVSPDQIRSIYRYYANQRFEQKRPPYKVHPCGVDDVVQAIYLQRAGQKIEDIAYKLRVNPKHLSRLVKITQYHDGQTTGPVLCGECKQWAYTGRMEWPAGMVGVCERDSALTARSDKCRYGDEHHGSD